MHSFSDVIDSSSTIYRPLLQSAPIRAALAAADLRAGILDYGCGRGALRGLLLDLGLRHRYFGYDIDRHAIAALRAADLGEDVRFSSSLPDEEFGAVVMVNVLVYTADAEFDVVVGEAVSRLRPDGSLIVVEPWPAWYWETRFGGLRLRMRAQHELLAPLARNGLSHVESATLGLFGWRHRALAPIAWLGVWRSSKDNQPLSS